MSIEEARAALAAANAYLKKPWADTTRFGSALPCIIHAIEALIDAKLSPAQKRVAGASHGLEVETARVADLEARLAEAETEIANLTHDLTKAFDENGAAERALADATKRIEALEAGLRNPTPAMRRKAADILTVVGLDEAWDIGHDLLVRVGAVLLSPASEGKTDG